MGELLTTGEMIDQLKVGKIAKSGTGRKVQKADDGEIFDCVTFEVVELDERFLKQRWEILPNYVSFEDAMKALKEGHAITLHLEDGGYTSFNEADRVKFLSDDVAGITFNDLCFGKWTIEE